MTLETGRVLIQFDYRKDLVAVPLKKSLVITDIILGILIGSSLKLKSSICLHSITIRQYIFVDLQGSAPKECAITY